jgi:hypothetical protein
VQEEGRVALVLAMLADDGHVANLWMVVGAGSFWPARDPRDCFASVQRWYADGGFVTRITDAKESPFRAEPIFVDGDARLLDRDEAIDDQAIKDWIVDRAIVVSERDEVLSDFMWKRMALRDG